MAIPTDCCWHSVRLSLQSPAYKFGGVAGGEIASTFDSPDKLKLGSCKLIEEIMIGEDKLIHFSGVEMGEACTIVLRGASKCYS